jgi:hypothetical protein
LSRDRAEEVEVEEEEEEAGEHRESVGRMTERKGIDSILFQACICCDIILLYIQWSVTTSS